LNAGRKSVDDFVARLAFKSSVSLRLYFSSVFYCCMALNCDQHQAPPAKKVKLAGMSMCKVSRFLSKFWDDYKLNNNLGFEFCRSGFF
jgi:hypothetical protein